MRTISLLFVTAALAGCAAVPPEPRSAQAEAKLQQELAGRVAGTPVTCLPPQPTSDMITIDDDTILFRRGGTVYRNDPPGGCAGLSSGFYALVTRSSGSGLCRGDIAQVTDPQTGMMVGTCTLSEFVPYTRPAG